MLSECFSTLLDIDKLTQPLVCCLVVISFSTLLDIDKLTHVVSWATVNTGFSTLLDIDNVVMITVYFSVFKLLATCDLRQILL